MKKYWITMGTLLALLSTTPVMAISLQELETNSQYIKIASDAQRSTYIDIQSVKALQYAPPHYVLDVTSYQVSSMDKPVSEVYISESYHTFAYNIEDSMATILNKPNWTYTEKGRYKSQHLGMERKGRGFIGFDGLGNKKGSSLSIDKEYRTPKLGDIYYRIGEAAFKVAYGDYFDNMATADLILNMLAEAATKDITNASNPEGLDENILVAQRGSKIVGNVRKEIERETGRSVITSRNAIDFGRLISDVVKEIPITNEERELE